MFADANATTINSPLFGYIGIGLTAIGLLIHTIFIARDIYNKKHQVSVTNGK